MQRRQNPFIVAPGKISTSVPSEATLRRFIADLPDAVLVHVDGTILYVNPACVRLLGAKSDEHLSGKHISLIIHPDDFAHVQSRIDEHYRINDALPPDECRLVSLDGSVIPVEAVATPTDWEGERAIQVVLRDIRKRKLAEHQHYVWQKRLELAQQGGLKIGLWDWDLATNTVIWSDESYRQFGIDRHDSTVPVGDAMQRIHPDDRPIVEAEIGKVLTGASDYAAQYRVLRPDGTISWIDAHGVLVDNGSTHMLGVGIDITERKVLEHQFWQSQKLEAIGCLAGGVAHDFNNVLMIVSSYADMIVEMNIDHPKLKEYATTIRQASFRAATVTQQLLAFSRKQILEPEVLDINHVVKDLNKILPKLLGEDINIVTRLDPAVRRIKVDRGQLEQIVMNLAVNARDAMPKGGELVIDTRHAVVNAKYADAHRPMTPGEYMMLSVSDNGTGMDAATQARIFEPFFTTKERGRGTGLGLASVYGIVKQSGGFIWLTSELGKGTTFEICLPYAPETPLARPATSASKVSSGHSETILLVEDETGLRTAVREFLGTQGYNVLSAGDAVEALRLAEQYQGTIDALLTDLVMPGMDGIELGKTVRSKYPKIRTLFMSGYHDRAADGLNPDAILLRKPCSLQVIAAKLNDALQRHV
ncbi:MAG TPA: PAS domain-containing protein [Candidatus Koribacter sp.]|jgi:PAS domain S-box-containing protein